jgi:hypothetical protein
MYMNACCNFIVAIARQQGRGVEVLKLQKSGGVVKREREERRSARDSSTKTYFYGWVGRCNQVIKVS